MKFALSVTHRVGTGGMSVWAAAGAATQTRSNRAKASRNSRNLELHLRRTIGAGSRFEVRFFRESQHPGNEDGWKPRTRCVELLGSFVEPHAFDGNPVFGPGELDLQIGETLSGFQLGIPLDNNHQTRQRR